MVARNEEIVFQDSSITPHTLRTSKSAPVRATSQDPRPPDRQLSLKRRDTPVPWAHALVEAAETACLDAAEDPDGQSNCREALEDIRSGLTDLIIDRAECVAKAKCMLGGASPEECRSGEA